MNLGFNFDDSYDQVTSKNFHANETLNDTGESSTSVAISKPELLNLLALCESDLERKDKLIERLNVSFPFFLFYFSIIPGRTGEILPPRGEIR